MRDVTESSGLPVGKVDRGVQVHGHRAAAHRPNAGLARAIRSLSSHCWNAFCVCAQGLLSVAPLCLPVCLPPAPVACDMFRLLLRGG